MTFLDITLPNIKAGNKYFEAFVVALIVGMVYK